MARRICTDCRQRDYFVALAINEPDGDLNTDDAMLASVVDGLLRMLKIEGIIRVRRPIPQAP